MGWIPSISRHLKWRKEVRVGTFRYWNSIRHCNGENRSQLGGIVQQVERGWDCTQAVRDRLLSVTGETLHSQWGTSCWVLLGRQFTIMGRGQAAGCSWNNSPSIHMRKDEFWLFVVSKISFKLSEDLYVKRKPIV